MPSHGSLQQAVKARPGRRGKESLAAGLPDLFQLQARQHFCFHICGVNHTF